MQASGHWQLVRLIAKTSSGMNEKAAAGKIIDSDVQYGGIVGSGGGGGGGGGGGASDFVDVSDFDVSDVGVEAPKNGEMAMDEAS